jgi:hypothetical protein
MKLLFAGFSLVAGFTFVTYIFSLLIKYSNSVVDKKIKKAEDELKSVNRKFKEPGN